MRYRIVHDPIAEKECFRAEVRVWWWWELLGYREDRAECDKLIEDHVSGQRKEYVVWEGNRKP